MKNSDSRYGFVFKFLHWAGFLLVVNQFLAGWAMVNTPTDETMFGLTQGFYYMWHKSVGLLVLAMVMARYVWRKMTPLPDWAPNLSHVEKRAIHWIERLLYACMFVLPVSGYVFVMASDNPLPFFWLGEVPHLVGVNETLASAAEWTHKTTAILMAAALLGHWGIVAWHQWRHHDRYVHRMLPFTHQR